MAAMETPRERARLLLVDRERLTQNDLDARLRSVSAALARGDGAYASRLVSTLYTAFAEVTAVMELAAPELHGSHLFALAKTDAMQRFPALTWEQAINALHRLDAIRAERPRRARRLTGSGN
jgi:hypothetical protein